MRIYLCRNIFSTTSINNLFLHSMSEYYMSGKVRLVGGSSSQGRVEVYHNGKWGTVCDDNWDINDAQVACRNVGFSRATAAYQSAKFGKGTGEIWLDEVGCTGSERYLEECASNGWGSHDCSHSEDASVACSGKIRFEYLVIVQ